MFLNSILYLFFSYCYIFSVFLYACMMFQDAVTKYMSKQLWEKKVGNSNVLEVQNELNIWDAWFLLPFFLWQQFGRYG